jgi:hypothetical protein
VLTDKSSVHANEFVESAILSSNLRRW